MDTTTEILERIDFIWNLILLPSTVILNVSAFVLILKNAGSCYNDPIVPPLLSVTGIGILHAVLVQIFTIHQQYEGSFVFTLNVCHALVCIRDILSDVPFLTIALQIIFTLRNALMKTNASYSHCSVCSKQVLIVFLPWVISIFLNIVIKNQTGAVINDKCVSDNKQSVEDFIIHWSIVMISPIIIVILGVIISSLNIATNKQFHRIRKNKQDFILLSVLFLAFVIIQAPARVLQWTILYNNSSEHEQIINLVMNIIFNLPLIINPLGVLIIRRSTKANSKVRRFESEEHLTLIVEMDQKELENALFEAKTTTL